VEVLFDRPVEGLINPADFALECIGGPCPNPPMIESVVIDGAVVRITFDRPINERRWTCIRWCGNRGRVCWGRLPADVDGNGAATPADLLPLIDALNGITALEEYQCDIDLSNHCTPADVLGVIDLLNGAGFDEAYDNVTMPVACPTGTPGP